MYHILSFFRKNSFSFIFLLLMLHVCISSSLRWFYNIISCVTIFCCICCLLRKSISEQMTGVVIYDHNLVITLSLIDWAAENKKTFYTKYWKQRFKIPLVTRSLVKIFHNRNTWRKCLINSTTPQHPVFIDNRTERYIPVRKLMMISKKNTVSEIQLNAIHSSVRSLLKNDMATGKMMRLARRRTNMNRSQ